MFAMSLIKTFAAVQVLLLSFSQQARSAAVEYAYCMHVCRRLTQNLERRF